MSLLEAALSNAIVATIPALLAITIAHVCDRPKPALVRALWLLVLLKLVTPPLAPLPCWTITSAADERLAVVDQRPSLARDVAATEAHLVSRSNDEVDNDSASHVALDFLSADKHNVPASDEDRIDNFDLTATTAAATSNRATSPRALSIPTIALAPQQWIRLGWWLWLAGSSVYLCWTAIQIRRFWLVIRLANDAPDSIERRVRLLAARMGLRGAPAVRVLPGIATPMIWAPWRAYLLIPTALLEQIDDAQLEALLAHELAHLRSRDHWVRRAEILVGALYWWHPVVWLAKRRIREAEEQICDAWVVTILPGISKIYATTLVDIVSLLSGARPHLPPTATGLSHFHSIQGRIKMIMQGATSPRLSWAGWLAILTAAALLIPIAPTLTRATPQREGEPSAEGQQLEVTLVPADAEGNEGQQPPLAIVEVALAALEREWDEEDEPQRRDDDDEGDEHEGEDRDDHDGGDHDGDDEQEEAEEAVEEMIEEIQEAIAEMDEEINEAIEEAHEELVELVEEAPQEIQREMIEIDMIGIVGDAVAEAPKPVRMFVKAVDPAGVIKRQLAEVAVELKEIESDGQQRPRVEARMERFLRQHIREMSKHTENEIRNIRREIQRETSRSPKIVQEILEGVRFDEIIQDATDGTSPIVQQIVQEIDVPEMVKQGLAQRRQERYQRERREWDDRDRGARSRERERPAEGGGRFESRREGLFEGRAPEGGRFEGRREGLFEGRPPEGGRFEGGPPEGHFEGRREGLFEGRAPEGGRFEGRPPEGRFEGRRGEGRAEGATRERDRDRSRDVNTRRYDQLERRLERLLREAESIRREMEEIKPGRDDRRSGAR